MTDKYNSSQILTECGRNFTWYSFGNESARPILFLHGGPGSGFNFDYIGLVGPLLNDANFITFDQRGCGNSSGFNFPDENNTSLLLNDIELLRQYFGIQKWIVSGHSWGATLALLYAQKSPEYCGQLFLSSTFLGRRKDQDWTFKGARQILPDIFGWVDRELKLLFPDFKNQITVEEQFLNGLQSSNIFVRYRTAYIFGYLSQNLTRLKPLIPELKSITDKDVRRAELLLSYAGQDFFVNPDLGAIHNPNNLKNIPMTLLHGEFDLDCPVEEIKNFVQKFPHMDLNIIPGAHSMFEEPMRSKMVKILKKILT